MAIYLICFPLLAILYGANGELTENSATGIIFTKTGQAKLTYDQWKICYGFNLKEYHEQIAEFKICIEKIDLICSKIDDINCKTITSYFHKEQERMLTEMEKIDAEQIISKRKAPLAFVGEIYHDITGIVDEETAERYEAKFNEIITAINEHHNIENNKTTLIRKTIVATQNATNILKSNLFTLHNDFKREMQNTNNILNDTTVRNKLSFIIQVGTMIIFEHKQITDRITNKPADFIPLDSIDRDLNKIKNLLNDNQKLPLELRKKRDALDILKISHKKLKINKNFVLLEVSIPIVENEQFDIFATTPIPIVLEGAMFGIRTFHKILLANMKRGEVIEISEDEYKKCTSIGKSEFLCQTSAPKIVKNHHMCETAILFDEPKAISENCEIGKIPNSTYLSSIYGTDSYIITPNKQAKIKLMCDSHTEVVTIKLQTKLTLETDCETLVDRYSLKKHSIHILGNNSEIINLEISLKNFNFTRIKETEPNLKIKMNTLLVDDSNDFNEILNQFKTLEKDQSHVKKIEKLETDSSWHSFSLMGLSTSTLLVIAVIAYLIIAKIFPITSAIANWATIIPNFSPAPTNT